MGSRRESTGSMVHRTGSITHVDGSRTHRDGSMILPDGKVRSIPEKLMHRSGSITHRSGSRTHRTGSQTHVDGSRTHRTGSITRADGSRVHRNKTITPGPGDSREVCMLGDRVKMFFGSTGYITTERLLKACQSFHLFARPSIEQGKLADVKSHWLEKEKRIGWMFRGAGTQHACFLSRVSMERNEVFTPVQTSDWRRFLRLYMPIIEALLFADGNAVMENEANAYYGSFGVAFMRGLLFILFGFLATRLLLPIYAPVNLDTPILTNSLDRPTNKAILNEDIQEHVFVIQRDVEKHTSFFLHTAIVIGSLVSRRVRCLLVLILPIVAMRSGHIYLANEMLHAVLVGPVASSEQNVLATGKTIGCLAEMSHNVTRDFERAIWLNASDDEVGEIYRDFIGEDQTDFRNETPSLLKMATETSRSFIQAIEKYRNMWPPIENLHIYYEKMTESVKKNFTSNEFTKAADRIIQELDKYTESKRTQFEAGFKNLSDGSSLSESFLPLLRQQLNKGVLLEKTMNQYLITICISHRYNNITDCRKLAHKVCSSLNSVISNLLYEPAWYRQLCDRSNSYDSACSVVNFLRDANLQCGLVPNAVGVESALGVSILGSRSAMDSISGAFNMNVTSKENEIQLHNYSAWLQFPPNVVQIPESIYSDRIATFFYIMIVTSTFGRLSFLGVLYGAHSYISNYLIDTNFDNLYVGNLFEFIDAKHLSEGRETLLPLKSMESPQIYWRRKCYTSTEIQRLCVHLIFAVFAGSGLLIAFAVDVHLYEMVIFLVDLTAGYYGMSVRIRDTHFKGTYAAVNGDGLFYNLTNKLIKNLKRLRDFNLNYDSSYCCPYAYQTNESHLQDFYRSWYLLMGLVVLGPFLLRLRHIVTSFFYPSRNRSRAVALYNSLLVQRRRHMTLCRNLVVHWVRESRLQQEARFLSEPNALVALFPKVATLLGLDKKTCIICQDRLPAGRKLSVCTLDHAATCRQCAAVVLKKDLCLVCLDRNPKRLFKERRKIQRMENKINVRISEM